MAKKQKKIESVNEVLADKRRRRQNKKLAIEKGIARKKESGEIDYEITGIFSSLKERFSGKKAAKKGTAKPKTEARRPIKAGAPKTNKGSVTKTILVDLVAKKTRQTKKATKETLDVMLDTISQSADKGKKVSLQNFGTFKQVQRKAREIVSIADGKKKRIPAHKAVKFTASKSF